jgi:hypothetical protein
MVLLFFCVSGVLGEIRRHPSVTTRDEGPDAIRPLEADARLLAQTIEPFAGTVVVIGNDWPFIYDLDFLKQACVPLGRRVVGSVMALGGGTKESAVLTYMEMRPDPFIIVASPDFEFTESTAARRVDVNPKTGFDDESADRVRILLRECGSAATEAPSNDDVLRARVGVDLLQFKRRVAAVRPGANGQEP